ncbi:rCG22137 [Rattus norvegicus]|uniref:RCG22137 n=1 Tax=Rattus norvegicus TaxID=10116 RepID=A6K4B4_RAT|nr:rCG22137 [Rattus norvegicus]
MQVFKHWNVFFGGGGCRTICLFIKETLCGGLRFLLKAIAESQ